MLAVIPVVSCGFVERAERPVWRTQAENTCLSQGLVSESAYIAAAPAIDGPGICGLTHPFKVTALAGGTVTLNTVQTLDCSMIPALDRWIGETVQPAAQASFGEPVVAIRAFGSYSCRGVSGSSTHYSEHAFGNAIDIAGFGLADGREVGVLHGWRGDAAEQTFLRSVHAGACDIFTTVLGPGYPQHDNHFHVDLARHGARGDVARRYCEPTPQHDLAAALRGPPALPTQEGDAIPQAPAGEFGMHLDSGDPPEATGYQGQVTGPRADAGSPAAAADVPAP